MEKQSKRNFPRIKIESFVSYVVVDRNKKLLGQGIGKVIDLSQGGFMLETHEPIDAPYLLLALVDTSKNNLSFLGEVAHTQNKGPGKYHTGIKLLEQAEKRKQVVTSLVRAYNHQRNLT